MATETIKTVDRNSQQLVLPFVLSVFSIAVKRFRTNQDDSRIVEWGVLELCCVFATVVSRYETRQANSFIVAQLTVYCILFLRLPRFVFHFSSVVLLYLKLKMHIENCANKTARMQSIFRCVVFSSACLSLATVSLALCFATSGCSSNITDPSPFPPPHPSAVQCPVSKIDTLSDEVWLMWPASGRTGEWACK